MKNLGHCVSSAERQPCRQKRSRVKNAWHSMRADRFEWLHIYCVFVAQAQASLPSSSSNIDFECGKTKRNKKKWMNSPLFGALGLEWVRFEHCQNNVPIQAQKMVMVKGSRSRTMYVFLFYLLLHFRSHKLKNKFWRTHISHTMSRAHECFHYWRS